MSLNEMVLEEIRAAMSCLDLSGVVRLAELRQRSALSPREVEALYGLPQRTLQQWRSDGVGPKYAKPGDKTVVYRPQDIDEFLSQTTVKTYVRS